MLSILIVLVYQETNSFWNYDNSCFRLINQIEHYKIKYCIVQVHNYKQKFAIHFCVTFAQIQFQ